MKRLAIVVLLAFTFGCATTAPVDPNAPPPTQEQIEASKLEQQQNAINIANLGIGILQSYVILESDDWSEEKVAKYQFYIDELIIAIAVWQGYVNGGLLTDASLQQLVVDGLVRAMQERQRTGMLIDSLDTATRYTIYHRSQHRPASLDPHKFYRG